jgi:hypothetical protein
LRISTDFKQDVSASLEFETRFWLAQAKASPCS